MGGEPTFVALDDAAAPEWNIAALGPTKRDFADKLARGLCARFASGALLHHGQGKWYPGEQAARWAFGIHWRSDGKPLWRDASLIAEERPETPATVADAEKLAGALCRALGLSGDSAIPAYEDAAHFALAEQKLPLGVAPQDNKLAEPAERERLIRAFDRGLDQPVGYVLPLLVTQDAKRKRRFITERWVFKRGHLYLIPGDSPLGLRLPLAGLPEISFEDYPHVLPADPFAAPKDMAGAAELVNQDATVQPSPDKPEFVRTALTVEARDGHVCIFLPPLQER